MRCKAQMTDDVIWLLGQRDSVLYYIFNICILPIAVVSVVCSDALTSAFISVYMGFLAQLTTAHLWRVLQEYISHLHPVADGRDVLLTSTVPYSALSNEILQQLHWFYLTIENSQHRNKIFKPNVVQNQFRTKWFKQKKNTSRSSDWTWKDTKNCCVQTNDIL